MLKPDTLMFKTKPIKLADLTEEQLLQLRTTIISILEDEYEKSYSDFTDEQTEEVSFYLENSKLEVCDGGYIYPILKKY